MPKLLVLIIEDDVKLGDLFAEILQFLDLETEVIRDGQQAMDRLGGIVPDLVVLDMHLPHVSGREILSHIRAEERLRKIKVLVATADASLARTMEDQADIVFIKPISIVQLNDIVARLIANVATG